MHKPVKYAEKALAVAANGAWQVFDTLNSIKPEPFVHAEVVRQAAAEVLARRRSRRSAGRATPIRCARKCVPEIRQQILDGKLPHEDPAQRKSRRDQGPDHRARRQDPDGEGLPDARPL